MAAPPTAVYKFKQLVILAVTACSLLFAPLAIGQTSNPEDRLSALTQERESLSKKLEQYQKTMQILGADEPDPSQSTNPAVRNLAIEMAATKAQLIKIIEQEVNELQAQISTAHALAATVETQPEEEAPSQASQTTEPSSPAASISREEESVARLLALLARHYSELQESLENQPSEEELKTRNAVQSDAEALAHIPYSADKVRLSGSEGSTALALITQRLGDSSIPDSRRKVARIFSVKTRVNGALVSSENRSFKPVGKNHYIAKVRLQPGRTSVLVANNSWDISIPDVIGTADYLITLYTPSKGKPEFHVFSIDDLLAQENPYLPPWLPSELQLTNAAG